MLLHYLEKRGNTTITFSLECCISRDRYSSWTVLHAQCIRPVGSLPQRKIAICAVFDSIYIC